MGDDTMNCSECEVLAQACEGAITSSERANNEARMAYDGPDPMQWELLAHMANDAADRRIAAEAYFRRHYATHEVQNER